MKRILVLLAFAAMSIPTVHGQYLEIGLTNGPHFCCGYQSSNQACVLVKKAPPLAVSEHTTLVYTWYAKHEKGLKTWNTPVAERWVPLPWAGPYEVWVVVQYVDMRTRYAFAAFRSNAVIVNANNCEAPRTTKETDG